MRNDKKAIEGNKCDYRVVMIKKAKPRKTQTTSVSPEMSKMVQIIQLVLLELSSAALILRHTKIATMRLASRGNITT